MIGSALGALGGLATDLSLGGLLGAATRRTRLSDFGDPYFKTGLRTLLAAIENDAHLHVPGRVSLRQVIIDNLVNRLLLTRAQRTWPEIFTGPIIAPLIVLGLPRSGTTLLHRLLATDPAHYAPPYWELARPLALPGRPDGRRQYAALTLAVGKGLGTGLDAKHFIAAGAPEEDLFLLGATFQTWYYWMAAPVYGYLDWYIGQDLAAKYREYRAWLHVLQAAHPGRRLVLKSPEHTGGMAALLNAVPEARLIQLHRDPVTAFASYVSLTRTCQAMFCSRPDRARTARASLALLAAEIRRNLAARDSHPGAVLDIRYEELIADPVSAVQRVYRWDGLAPAPATATQVRRYLRHNPQGKYGAHHYQLDADPPEGEVRARFGAYCERFGYTAR